MDQEEKEIGTCGSHLKKKNNKHLGRKDRIDREREKERKYFNFFSLFILSQIYENLTVEIRRA